MRLAHRNKASQMRDEPGEPWTAGASLSCVWTRLSNSLSRITLWSLGRSGSSILQPSIRRDIAPPEDIPIFCKAGTGGHLQPAAASSSRVIIGRSCNGPQYLRTGKKRRRNGKNASALGASRAVAQGHANVYGLSLFDPQTNTTVISSESQDSRLDAERGEAAAGACRRRPTVPPCPLCHQGPMPP